MHKLAFCFETNLSNAEVQLELLIACILIIYIKYRWMQNVICCIAVRIDFSNQFVFHRKAKKKQ